jgi:hypothetical protein
MKVLNSSGAQVYYRADSSDNEADAILPLDVIADLRSNTDNAIDRVSLAGHTTEGDGGGGEFWLDTSDTTTADDNGINIVDSVSPRIGTWKRIWSGKVNLRWFGANPANSAVVNTPLMQAALNFVAVPEYELYSPWGVYLHTGLTYTSAAFADSLRIFGDGFNATIWKNTATDGSHGLEIINTAGTEPVWGVFEAFSMEGNASSGDGFHLELCGRFEFREIYSYDNGGDGFHYENSWSPSFIRCRGDRNGGYGAYLLGGVNHKINGSYFEGGAYSSNILDGIYIEAGPDDDTISGSIVNVGLSNNDRNGIWCKSPGLLIDGTFPEFNKGAQIKIGDAADARTVVGVQIRGSYVDARNVGGTNYRGIVIEEARGVSIDATNIKNVTSAIEIDAASTDITVGTQALNRLGPTATNLVDLNGYLITDQLKGYHLRAPVVEIDVAPVQTVRLESGSSGLRLDIENNGATASDLLYRVQKDGATQFGIRNDGKLLFGEILGTSALTTQAGRIEVLDAAGASQGFIEVKTP